MFHNFTNTDKLYILFFILHFRNTQLFSCEPLYMFNYSMSWHFWTTGSVVAVTALRA